MNPGTLALYGGTFDPIHLGHTQVVQAARAAFGFHTVRVLPAADPPLRAPPGASAAHRLAMARLACAELPGFVVDERELHRQGPSYTVDTLADVRAEIGPERPLVWLLGRDAVARIDRWHRYEALLAFAHFLVLDRPGWTVDEGAEPVSPAVDDWVRAHQRTDPAELGTRPAGGLFFFAGPRIAISATDVRRACARHAHGQGGADPAGLLAPKVWSYICEHGLYGTPPGSGSVRDADDGAPAGGGA